MIAKNKSDCDDLVDNDTYQDTNEEESEGKYQKKESKNDKSESDKSEADESDQIENAKLIKRMETPTKGDDDYLAYTDTDREINN